MSTLLTFTVCILFFWVTGNETPAMPILEPGHIIFDKPFT